MDAPAAATPAEKASMDASAAATPAEKAMGEIGQRLASIGATKLPPDDEAPAPAKPAKAPALKLFVNYREGDDESLHMATKFVVPKGWRPGPVSKLLAFVVDTYNGKRAGNALDAAACHLEVGGLALGSEEVVEAVLKPRDEVLLRPGASLARGERALAAAAAEADARARADAARRAREGKVKCLNHGCGTLFDPNDNPAGACAHHRAPPFVSGGYKGWRCCNPKPTMDWDEFACYPACATGRHSAEPPPPFAPPAEAAKAAAAVESDDDDGGAAAAPAAAAAAAPAAPEDDVSLAAVPGDDGDFKCLNNGCGQFFWEEENFKGRCHFHKGRPEPARGEGLYRWSCCPSKTAARDELRSVPGCERAAHWRGAGAPRDVACVPCRWEF